MREKQVRYFLNCDKPTNKEVVPLINRQTLNALIDRWRNDFAAQKEQWDKKPLWPAKLVETWFTLNGINYCLYPADLGLSDDCWDQGFMESVQAEIGHDLEEYGAIDIIHCGFLD